jgi:hypothetical protein
MSRMSAHTPGPWIVSEYMDDGRLGVLSPQNEILCAVSTGLREPDAKLIAAAPEMAEALQRALNWLASYPGGNAEGAYNEVRAALAKAGL